MINEFWKKIKAFWLFFPHSSTPLGPVLTALVSNKACEEQLLKTAWCPGQGLHCPVTMGLPVVPVDTEGPAGLSHSTTTIAHCSHPADTANMPRGWQGSALSGHAETSPLCNSAQHYGVALQHPNYLILLQPNTSLPSYFAVFNWPTGNRDAYRNLSAAFYSPQLLPRADFFDKLQLIRASKSPHASAVSLWL